VRLWLDAVAGIVRRDAILYMSYRTQVLTQTLGLVFNLTLFYYISRLVTVGSFGPKTDYFAFVVIGLVIVQVTLTTLGLTPSTVRQELVAGTMERFLVSPFGVINGIIGMMVFPLLEAFATGAVMLILAAVIFGLPLAATAPLALPVGVLASFAFVPFALLLVSLVLAIKQASTGAQFISSGIGIVGGLYFPTSLLPGWISWTSYVQPFTPATDLLRHLLVGTALKDSAWIDLAKVAAFGGLLFPIALLVLRRAVTYGQRRGTIIEY
jgi:ABC-2 type transport system permease protein